MNRSTTFSLALVIVTMAVCSSWGYHEPDNGTVTASRQIGMKDDKTKQTEESTAEENTVVAPQKDSTTSYKTPEQKAAEKRRKMIAEKEQVLKEKREEEKRKAIDANDDTEDTNSTTNSSFEYTEKGFLKTIEGIVNNLEGGESALFKPNSSTLATTPSMDPDSAKAKYNKASETLTEMLRRADSCISQINMEIKKYTINNARETLNAKTFTDSDVGKKIITRLEAIHSELYQDQLTQLEGYKKRSTKRSAEYDKLITGIKKSQKVLATVLDIFGIK